MKLDKISQSSESIPLLCRGKMEGKAMMELCETVRNVFSINGVLNKGKKTRLKKEKTND